MNSRGERRQVVIQAIDTKGMGQPLLNINDISFHRTESSFRAMYRVEIAFHVFPGLGANEPCNQDRIPQKYLHF